MIAHDPLVAFADAMRAAGIEPPGSIAADGKLHRFPTNGHRHDDGGWYLLHLDGIAAGAYGDWRTGVSDTWCARRPDTLTDAERAAWRARVEKARQEAAAERERENAEAARKAAYAWKRGRTARGDHPYLTRKVVKPTATLRELLAAELGNILGYSPSAKGEPFSGRVLIAPVVIARKVSSLEFIDENGRKAFLKGGAIAGGIWATGKLPDGDGENLTILVAEGVATALSVAEATGHVAVAALSAGNLLAAARAVRARLPGATIVVLAELDESGVGLGKAREAALAVGGLVATPDFGEERSPGASDMNDLAALHGFDAVRQAIAAAKEPDAQEPAANASAPPSGEPTVKADEPGPENSWPALDKSAFHGLAGEIVRAIEPHSEADPAALLLGLHASFGNAIGRGPFYQVEGDRHGTNLFVVEVGETSKARKGTGASRIRQIFATADEEWTRNRIHTGLSSGEGVIWEVRDPIIRTTTDKKTGERIEEEADHGISDKRLMVIESEFSGALRVMQREGNTLSRVIRDAWDRGNLASLTKNNQARATNALISIIGHITAHELSELLDRTDMANGFANRFLFACVRRSKALPFGGNLAETTIAAFGEKVKNALCRARNIERVTMDPEAREAWGAIYAELSEGRPGLLGSITARAEAQTVRLAMMYALWDSSPVITKPHLEAALSVWEFCEESARYIFGDALGDPIADTILDALKKASDAGLSRTNIYNLFARNVSSAQIARALVWLAQHGRAAATTEKSGGRPIETWKVRTGA